MSILIEMLSVVFSIWIKSLLLEKISSLWWTAVGCLLNIIISVFGKVITGFLLHEDTEKPNEERSTFISWFFQYYFWIYLFWSSITVTFLRTARYFQSQGWYINFCLELLSGRIAFSPHYHHRHHIGNKS